MTLTDFASLRARFTRKSLWQVKYTNGLIVNEWQTDWSLLPFEGRKAVRLYCPNGQVAELGNSEDATGRLFQFKRAVMQAGVGQITLAQIIGLIDSPNGDCTVAIWEYDTQRLLNLRDNVKQFRYDHIGALSFSALGISL